LDGREVLVLGEIQPLLVHVNLDAQEPELAPAASELVEGPALEWVHAAIAEEPGCLTDLACYKIVLGLRGRTIAQGVARTDERGALDVRASEHRPDRLEAETTAEGVHVRVEHDRRRPWTWGGRRIRRGRGFERSGCPRRRARGRGATGGYEA